MQMALLILISWNLFFYPFIMLYHIIPLVRLLRQTSKSNFMSPNPKKHFRNVFHLSLLLTVHCIGSELIDIFTTYICHSRFRYLSSVLVFNNDKNISSPPIYWLHHKYLQSIYQNINGCLSPNLKHRVWPRNSNFSMFQK